jgi:uncharacterized protein (TIGR02266 family)
MVEQALRVRETEAEREDRSLLVRVWTLFVPVYDELCRVGRFVTHGRDSERSFPPLAMIAAHRRAKRQPTSLLPPRPAADVSERVGESQEVGAREPVGDITVPRVEAADVETLLEDVETLLEAPSRQAPPPLPLPVVATSVAPSPPSGGADLRRTARRPVEVEVAVSTDSNFYAGFTENLSGGGVFVATYFALPIGSLVEVDVHLPIGSLKLAGIVRWVRRDGADSWPGMGIQFEQLGPDDEKCIREFLGVREPLFFDEG